MRKTCGECGTDWWRKVGKKDICRRCGAERAAKIAPLVPTETEQRNWFRGSHT